MAAFVVEDSHGGDKSKTSSRLALTTTQFAALGVAGLRSKNTVRAEKDGGRKPATPSRLTPWLGEF